MSSDDAPVRVGHVLMAPLRLSIAPMCISLAALLVALFYGPVQAHRVPAFAVPPEDVITVRQLRVVDAQGHLIAYIGPSSDGSGCSMGVYGRDGFTRAELGTVRWDPDTRSSGPNDQQIGTVRLYGSKGRLVVAATAVDDGRGGVFVYGQDHLSGLVTSREGSRLDLGVRNKTSKVTLYCSPRAGWGEIAVRGRHGRVWSSEDGTTAPSTDAAEGFDPGGLP